MFPLSESTIKARRTMSPTERLLDHQSRLYFWTNLGLGIALVLGFIVILVHGGNWTTAIAAFGASLGAGGVLGFLFGVPSTLKTPVNINSAGNVAVATGNNSPTVSADVIDDTGAAPAQTGAPPTQPSVVPHTNPSPASSSLTLAPAPSPSIAPKASPPSPPGPSSTPTQPTPPPGPAPQPPITVSSPSVSNLEQVADWVTKLLLGGGLTQMQRIPPKIWQWAHVVALGIIGDDPKINDRLILAQQAFAAGLLVYGFILGFFSGYLITKLQLGKAIAE
jgi:hypothetical protein